MIIAIDANEANVKRRVGVNQFAFEVIWSLYRKRKSNKIKDRFLLFLKEKPLADLPPKQTWWQYDVFGPKQLWTLTGLPKRLFFDNPKPDILFSPSHYAPSISPVPIVISIMDLGFLKWPEQFTKKDFFQLKYLTRISVQKARKVIAISEFTKKDLINTYGLTPEKIVVAHPGWKKSKVNNSKKSNFKQLKNKYGIKKQYLVFLGTLKPSKNIVGLIKAFSQIKNKHDYQLVIIGKKGWLYQKIFEKVKTLELTEQVIFTDFVDDKQAEILIKHATAFVLPSFWEGFGIPILEAMAQDIPVTCSNAGSLPEIAGPAALIFDPNDLGQMTQAINQILTNKTVREKLIKAGRERVKLFNWDNCSRIIYNTLKQ